MDNVRVLHGGDTPSTSSPRFVEKYYFARGMKTSSNAIPTQIQRVHKNRHADAIFDIKREGSKKNAWANSIRRNSNNAFPTTVPYHVYHYECSMESIIEFNNHGVIFNPASTPRTSGSGNSLERINKLEKRRQSVPPPLTNSSSFYGSFSKLARPQLGFLNKQSNSSSSSLQDVFDSDSSGSTSSLQDKLQEKLDSSFFSQVVIWKLIKESPTQYRLIERSTMLPIGKWVKKRSSNSEEDIWVFVTKGQTIARLRGESIEIFTPDTLSSIFVDSMTLDLRERYYNKSIKECDVTTPSKPTSSPKIPPCRAFSASAVASASTSDCLAEVSHIKVGSRRNSGPYYRVRFVDGLIFSSLSLRLALSIKETTPAEVQEKIYTTSGEKRRSSTGSTSSATRRNSIPRTINYQLVVRPVRTVTTIAKMQKSVVSSIKQAIL